MGGGARGGLGWEGGQGGGVVVTGNERVLIIRMWGRIGNWGGVGRGGEGGCVVVPGNDN